MTSFAGFTYPRLIAKLPKGKPMERLAIGREFAKKYGSKRLTGPYYQNEPSINPESTSFYLDSDFMFGLRWEWADEVEDVRIVHQGWFDNEHGDGDVIRGIVFRLPGGRGFLAGWSYPEGMAGAVEHIIYESQRKAAYAANRIAERVAEDARDMEADYQAELRKEEEKEQEQADRIAMVDRILTQGGLV